MNEKRMVVSDVVRLAAVDAFFIALACLMPVLAHRTAFPLHYFDPLRLLVLSGLFWTASRRNACLLALLLPLFAFSVSGYPLPLKGVLIGCELVVNVLLFALLNRKMRSVFMPMFLSILLSKVVYYLLKWCAVSMGLLDTSVSGTPLLPQLIAALSFSLIFAVVARRSHPDKTCKSF